MIEPLEARQLMHAGSLDSLILASLGGKERTVGTVEPGLRVTLAKAHPAERSILHQEMIGLKHELYELWVRLDAHRINGAHFRAERATLRNELHKIEHAWGALGTNSVIAPPPSSAPGGTSTTLATPGGSSGSSTGTKGQGNPPLLVTPQGTPPPPIYASRPTSRVTCQCPCEGQTNFAPSSPKSDGGDPDDNSQSSVRTNFGTGQVSNARDGLVSLGFGNLYGQTLEWSNVAHWCSYSIFGKGWVDSALPSLQQTTNGGLMYTNSGSGALWFDFNSLTGTYSAEFYESTEYTLKPDGSGGDFVLTDSYGDQLRLYGFESGLPTAEQGQFKSFTDSFGNVISVTSHTSSGLVSEVQRSATVNGTTTVESFLFTYNTTGVNAGTVSNVTLRRETNGGAWTTVRQAVYTYYDGTQSYGNAGDLMSEQIEDANNNVLDESYYRYYQAGDPNGYTDGLEYFWFIRRKRAPG